MSSSRDSQMDTLGTPLCLRVCLCVFITFVDYAYKNYTSPRSQRRAPSYYTTKDTTCHSRDYNGAVSFMVCSAFV
ncbi:uncharacterized protein [Drosophila takahashii]|uniref:uncharacterized protein isoform X7 n=1 Tax=Drosophila takahashii TaxID=29030 RepID=UPI0038995243